MAKKHCVYRNLARIMMIEGISITELSAMTGIEYKTLCKRMSGNSKLCIEEAILIYDALDRVVPMEKMFERE